MLKEVIVRTAEYLNKLNDTSCFKREDLFMAMQESMPNISESNFKKKLNQLMDNGELVRIGRNAYCVCEEGMKTYSYEYSSMAKEVVGLIKDNHLYLEFRVFELVQLNEFLNHQIAHNTIFVFVEGDLGEFVFDTLKKQFQGRLLINPTPEMYHQYWTDDMVVIMKLLSEAPSGKNTDWETCIEKMIVDLYCEKVLISAYPSNERKNIFSNIFEKYMVDESKLFRYARRRGVEKKLKNFLINESKVVLRLENKTK